MQFMLPRLLLVTFLFQLSHGEFNYQQLMAAQVPNESYVIPGDLLIPVLLPMRRYQEGQLCGDLVDKDAFEILQGVK